MHLMESEMKGKMARTGGWKVSPLFRKMCDVIGILICFENANVYSSTFIFETLQQTFKKSYEFQTK